jgi:hypothetical protein
MGTGLRNGRGRHARWRHEQDGLGHDSHARWRHDLDQRGHADRSSADAAPGRVA